MENLKYPIKVYNYFDSFELSLTYINNEFVFKSNNINNENFGKNVILSYIKNNKLELVWIDFFNKYNGIELNFEILKNNSFIFYLKNNENNIIDILKIKYQKKLLFTLNNKDELDICLKKFKNNLLQLIDINNNEFITNNNCINFNYTNFNYYCRQFLKNNKKKNLIKLINNIEILNYNYDSIIYESRYKYLKYIYYKKDLNYLYLIFPIRKIKIIRDNKYISSSYDCLELVLTEKQFKNSKIFLYYRKCYKLKELNKFSKFK